MRHRPPWVSLNEWAVAGDAPQTTRQDMSKRTVKAVYGTIEVEDGRGLRITVDDGPNRCVSVPIGWAAAKELGEILLAFAVVHNDGHDEQA